MIEVVIRNWNLKARKKNAIKKAADWFINKYKKKNHDCTIIITCANNNLGDFEEGNCIRYEDKKFTVNIDRDFNIKDTIGILFHELYHVFQLLSGDLEYIWKGNICEAHYKQKNYGNNLELLKQSNYSSLPWERAADKVSDNKTDEYFYLADFGLIKW